MIKVENLGKTDNYVYDISLDGTVINALGLNVCSNTDGFNFQLPESFKYTEDSPYISLGLNRNTEEGKKYVGYSADVAEFNDLFMRGKMGLGIDEIVQASVNISRKNYIDLLDDGSIKLVGNTVKSKKMPGYIEKFLNSAIKLLLHNKGQEFIEEYYDYINKIYNFQIPLRDIASRGKIKRTLEEYKKDMKTLNIAGKPKSRQAWYELVINNDIKVDVGDTVYYINTGTSKSHADVKKVTHKFIKDGEGNEVELTTKLEKEIILEYGKNNALYDVDDKKSEREFYKNFDKTLRKTLIKDRIIKEVYDIQLNSVLIPRDVVEAEEDTFCDSTIEYNVQKYIAQFNKRIKPLLVCFDRSIREDILINDPDDRKYFLQDQCALTYGQPNYPKDQDTYEQLMTMEDKEIKYWLSANEEPPFMSEMDSSWEQVKEDYINRMTEIRKLGIGHLLTKYEEIIDQLTEEDVESFTEDGVLPTKLGEFLVEDENSTALFSKEYNVIIGNTLDITDKDFSFEEEREYVSEEEKSVSYFEETEENVIDIASTNRYPSNILNNFAPNEFVVDGVLCGSMEGFLQSLKFNDIEEQKKVCAMIGYNAKEYGSNKNWSDSQTLYWNGVTYQRESRDYKKLLAKAYLSLFENQIFKQALHDSKNLVITHSMAKKNERETILTEGEFCKLLTWLRDKI